MASRASEWALLLLLALLLPFHLLSLFSRRSNSRRSGTARLMVPLISIPILVSAIFALSDLSDLESSNDEPILELEEMKLKLAHLESLLEENAKTLDFKTIHQDEKNKMIEEMSHKIQILQDALNKIKAPHGNTSYFEETIKAMEEEIRLLWAESRKNNFDIHILESKVYEEDKKFDAVASELEKMENIVTEQWIQIRQLEQALQTVKTMTSKVHKKCTSRIRRKMPTKCTIWKFFKGFRHHYHAEVAGFPDSFFLGGYISTSFISKAVDQLKRIMSVAKQWHHELQDSVKWTLEMNEFTAPFAHKEIVFFVASAMITFPIMGAWVLCSSLFGQPE